MKFWKWIIKCPLFVLICAGWIALTAFTWSEGRMPDTLEREIVEKPVFTALLNKDIVVPQDGFFAQNPDKYGMEDKNEQNKNEQNKNEDKNGNGTLDKNLDKNLDEALDETIDASAQIPAKNSHDSTKQDAGDQADGSGKENGTKGKNPVLDRNGSDSDTGKSGRSPQEADADENEQAGVTRFLSYKKKKTDSPYYSDPGKKALTTEYAYQDADESYFDDAVFIGDSRTVGMQDYSGLENATFFAKTGMNVYEVLEDKFITDPKTGKDVSVAHMLKKYKYGKIYFMVGINELGTGNTGTFQKAYERVIKKFRKWQPDAIIYIQGIIPVSKAKASGDAIFNNININDKNVAIAQLADGRHTFYLDVSGKLTDKKGYLKADYTFDEVHMYAQYYTLWTEYLMKHAVM